MRFYKHSDKIIVASSSHQGRTKAAPSLHDACVNLTSSLHKVCSGCTSVSRSNSGKHAGLLYKNQTGFGAVVPA